MFIQPSDNNSLAVHPNQASIRSHGLVWFRPLFTLDVATSCLLQHLDEATVHAEVVHMKVAWVVCLYCMCLMPETEPVKFVVPSNSLRSI